jgi:hypothetical protein
MTALYTQDTWRCSVQGAFIFVHDKTLEHRNMSILQAQATLSWTTKGRTMGIASSNILGINDKTMFGNET